MAQDLTVKQIVQQSHLCHPDWDVRTHHGYLVHEEGRDVSYAQVAALVFELRAPRVVDDEYLINLDQPTTPLDRAVAAALNELASLPPAQCEVAAVELVVNLEAWMDTVHGFDLPAAVAEATDSQ